MSRPRRRTPGTKFAGGHRIRVTPVPIPNTEVKPDTADGTAWETVWESRSLPAVIESDARELRLAGVRVYGRSTVQPWRSSAHTAAANAATVKPMNAAASAATSGALPAPIVA